MDNFEILIHFANERENIRLLKESGTTSGFTDDWILDKYRFCNVRRRHDRVSQWLLKEYYTDNIGDVWFRGLLARLVNWPPTLRYLMLNRAIPVCAEDFDAEYFVKLLDDLKQSTTKLYSSAYIVYPTRVAGNSKAYNLARYIIEPIIQIREQIRQELTHESIEGITTLLSTSFGISTFIAGQVAADLTYIQGQLDNAVDLYDWAPMGPGSRRGLNRLFDRSLTAVIGQPQFNEELTEVRGRLIKSNDAFSDVTLHDVQNVMCEYDKYMRALSGEGAPRQVYAPTVEF